MQVNKIQNNTSFKGIYINNITFPQVRNLAMSLKSQGFHPLGFKKYYTPNGDYYELSMRAKSVKRIGMYGIPKEFGTIYYPWKNAAYLIASMHDEQNIYEFVKRIYPNAVLNMLI